MTKLSTKKPQDNIRKLYLRVVPFSGIIASVPVMGSMIYVNFVANDKQGGVIKWEVFARYAIRAQCQEIMLATLTEKQSVHIHPTFKRLV